MKSNFEKLLLNKSEAAQALNVSVPSLNRYIRRGLIPVLRLGGRVLIPHSSLLEMIQIKTSTEAGHGQ
jgi:excisionase family DNA binding protein